MVLTNQLIAQPPHLANVSAANVCKCGMGHDTFYVGRGYNRLPYSADSLAKMFAGRSTLTPYRGDVIMVRGDHKEDVAATDLTLNKAGVNIIGDLTMGARPRISLTAAGSKILITAPGITIENMDFEIQVADLVTVFDVQAEGFRLINCRIFCQEFATHEYLIGVQANAGTAANFACDDPWTEVTTVTAGTFRASDVGRYLHVTAGTGFVTGRHRIITFNSDKSVILNTLAAGSSPRTNGTAFVGRASGMQLIGCQFQNIMTGTPAATECVDIMGASDNILIERCRFGGLFSVSAISADGAPCYNFSAFRNYIENRQTTNIADCIDLIAGTTGQIDLNQMTHLNITADNHLNCIDPAACIMGQNWISDVPGERGDIAGNLNADT